MQALGQAIAGGFHSQSTKPSAKAWLPMPTRVSCHISSMTSCTDVQPNSHIGSAEARNNRYRSCGATLAVRSCWGRWRWCSKGRSTCGWLSYHRETDRQRQCLGSIVRKVRVLVIASNVHADVQLRESSETSKAYVASALVDNSHCSH